MKCVKIISKDKDGEKIKPVIEIDKEKINEDLKYAGYNFKSTKPTIVYERLKNPSALQSLIWMHVRFMCKKRNNLWAFFNLCKAL